VRDALGLPQSVLVLGGTSEIGVTAAAALAERRAHTVVLAARDPSRAAEAAERLRAAGAETVEAMRFDASDDAEAHERFAEEVFDRFGDIDLVLVAFGILGDSERAATDGRAATELARTNYLGAVSALVPIAGRMRAQGHGALVVLSSVAGERVRKSNFVYGSSKAGLDGFAQGLGDWLAGSGVDVMVVRPGFVKTKMTAGLDPAPLSTTADAVARAILDGLARGSHTVWVPPALRYVMAALRHLPRPLFRRLDL
jgi:decaprenylphospho-beta-D-erythro-pentofuranosid-2-ulose 2-reductase